MIELAASGGVALVFPGQGLQSPGMLEPFRDVEGFAECVTMISDLLQLDVAQDRAWPAQQWRRNQVSSVMTIAASVLALHQWRALGKPAPVAVAGYSVGQWAALRAAEAIDEEQLFRLVLGRAHLMDAALVGRPASGMLGVIGLRDDSVEAVCAAARGRGLHLQLTNDNAPGQYTLGGDEEGLSFAESELRALGAKRLQRLLVAGAWHSSFLEPAVEPLAALIDASGLREPRLPVIDNTTGDWLPAGDQGRAALARQVAAPVRWCQGVRRMIDAGVATLLEVGYGDMLRRFGFFIDRSVTHEALVPVRAQAVR